MSFDPEVVERVAKAIFNSAGGYKIGWSRLTETAKESYRHQAREAIMAYENDFHSVQV